MLKTQRAPIGSRVNGAIFADGVTVAVGGLLQRESGFANHWDEAGTLLGVCVGGDSRDNTGTLLGESSDNAPPRAHYREGAVICHVACANSPGASGLLVYSADSDPASFTSLDTTNPPVGYIKEYRTDSDLDVQLFTEAAFRAGIADGTWNV